MIKYEYKDYTVVVSGGIKGIGKAISEAFLQSGARVIATYSSSDAIAEEFKNKWAGYPLELAKFDVSDYKQVEAFFGKLDKDYDSLEVLVNNAGIRKDNVVGLLSSEDWNSVLAVNLTGTYNMSKFALLKMMQNRYGRIINITSPSGKMGFAGQSNYAAAKAGQVAFAKSLSKEAARRSITVNSVSPGFIDTDFIADLPEELRNEYKAQVPVKRFGKPEDVANAILFLAARESSYITGTVLEVTGGL